MENKEKTSWGSPKDWGTAIGILITAIGFLSLISGVWTPDAAQSAGSGNTMRSVIILIVGIVIAGGSQLFLKPKS
jgi:hypothetical protein